MEEEAKEIVTKSALKQTFATKKANKIDLKALRDKDREMVRGIFRFHEVPGGTMKFPFRAYKEDDVEIYEFVDGQAYTIPIGLARHLNKDCWYPVHHYETDDAGKPSIRIGQKVHRCSFQSLDFVDEKDLPSVDNSGIVTVERVALL